MLLSLIACGIPAVDMPPKKVCILPLGDSITQGGRADREEYTYRLPLYQMLTKDKVDFAFVGSLKTGLQAEAKWPQPFDPNHEGHYGWKTEEVRAKLQGWVKGYANAPDIALIHLGSNDQNGDPVKDVAEPLAKIIETLRKSNPKIVILLGHLNFNGGAALKIRPVVEELAIRKSTAASPVRTVPHYLGWIENPASLGCDTFDWAHPNPQGQRKMADAWYKAMKPFLK